MNMRKHYPLGTILHYTYAQIRYYQIIEDHGAMLLAESHNQPIAEISSFR